MVTIKTIVIVVCFLHNFKDSNEYDMSRNNSSMKSWKSQKKHLLFPCSDSWQCSMEKNIFGSVVNGIS